MSSDLTELGQEARVHELNVRRCPPEFMALQIPAGDPPSGNGNAEGTQATKSVYSDRIGDATDKERRQTYKSPK
jgi:hypothetical protein